MHSLRISKLLKLGASMALFVLMVVFSAQLGAQPFSPESQRESEGEQAPASEAAMDESPEASASESQAAPLPGPGWKPSPKSASSGTQAPGPGSVAQERHARRNAEEAAAIAASRPSVPDVSGLQFSAALAFSLGQSSPPLDFLSYNGQDRNSGEFGTLRITHSASFLRLLIQEGGISAVLGAGLETFAFRQTERNRRTRLLNGALAWGPGFSGELRYRSPFSRTDGTESPWGMEFAAHGWYASAFNGTSGESDVSALIADGETQVNADRLRYAVSMGVAFLPASLLPEADAEPRLRFSMGVMLYRQRYRAWLEDASGAYVWESESRVELGMAVPVTLEIFMRRGDLNLTFGFGLNAGVYLFDANMWVGLVF